MKIKKRAFLRILFSFSFLLLFIGIGKGMHSLTGGFCLQKILADFSDRTPSKELSKEELNELDKILSQNFIYVAKGRQAYVFESEDGKYVLKFIRYHLLHPPFWMHLLQFPKLLNDYRKKEIKSKRNQLLNVMESYRLAYKELKEETQVLFVHLSKTQILNKRITLIDRIGRKYQVELDSMGFLLQKKALLLKDVLKQLRKKKDEERIREVYTAYLNVIFPRRSKGIINKDQCWYKNYGMIGGKACEIDMGSFAKEREEFNPELLRLKIHHNILPLRTWIEKNFPILLTDFDTCFDQNLEEFNYETHS